MPFVSSVRGSFGLQKRPFPRLVINSNNSSISGGTTVTAGGYRIHTYTSVGSSSFGYTYSGGTVNGASVSFPVEYLVVAGGGAGGTSFGAGGGAGGMLTGTLEFSPIGSATVTVGAGGARDTSNQNRTGNRGANSVFGSITSIGGGGGNCQGEYNPGAVMDGGSGGGSGHNTSQIGQGIAGQGNNGGFGQVGSPYGCAGGGGAGAVGGAATASTSAAGGIGLSNSLSGSAVFYAGGGGGGGGGPSYVSTNNYTMPAGGGGAGGRTYNPGSNGSDGTSNTGGGGGGSNSYNQGSSYSAGAGGSGIVIIRYPV